MLLPKTITINSDNDDTITRLRAGTGQVYADGDFTLLAGSEVTLAQGVDGNNDSGSITPQALVSGAGGTGSGLDGLDFFDLDGSHASLAEMDELLNLIRQCP